MNTQNEIKQFITEYCRKYPVLTIQDILKALHQSSFGCGHLLTASAYDYLTEEMDKVTCQDASIIPLPGAFSIVPLSYVKKLNMNTDTFYKIFSLSAMESVESSQQLEEKLQILMDMTSSQMTPFNYSKLYDSIEQWRKDGFSMLRHSQVFRDNYHPAYRVIHKKYLPFFRLFAQLDSLLQSPKPVLMAIEGGSAAGKSTLAAILSEVYDCNVFHVDDFFLRPEQRTAERLSEAGGNFDRERFYKTVINPLSKSESVFYEPYDCSTQQILSGIPYPSKKFNIVEGAYSMHPDLSGHYSLSVFLDIDKNLQRERIIKRNSPDMQERFFSTWIPMEEKYFKTFQIKESCSLIISIS